MLRLGHGPGVGLFGWDAYDGTARCLPRSTEWGIAMIARGRRRQPGVMNKLEADYARHLEARKHAGEVAWYEFEPVKLKLGNDWKTTILVDFFVMLENGELEAHEVKGGWFAEHNRAKLKVAARLFPFRFLVVRRQRVRDPWQYEEVA